jgi:soluble P-type ATPase
MLEFAIPGFGRLRLKHVALDYDGMLAVDGKPLSGVKRRLAALGIAVLEAEGASVEALTAADLVVASAADALDLLLPSRRSVATLRA